MSDHRWKFYRVGGVDQVVFRDGADIVNLPLLDQKLWVALACPVKGLEMDSRTLELIDREKDGRIRAPDVLEAVGWIQQVWKDPGLLLRAGEVVPLDAIRDDTAAGASVLEGARTILKNIGKGTAAEISLDDVRDPKKICAGMRFNGDGVILAETALEEDRRLVNEIAATMGTVEGRDGVPGVGQAQVERFFAEAAALAAWEEKRRSDRAVLPLGEETAAAAAALREMRVKVDDYFARVRLAAFDRRAAGHLNRSEAEFVQMAGKDLNLTAEEIQRLPLARIDEENPTLERDLLNPAWAARGSVFFDKVVYPVINENLLLNEEGWEQIKRAFAPFENWLASKPMTKVEGLGIERLREILDGGGRTRLMELIEQDLGEKARVESMGQVEKLVRFQRDFFRFLNNFVAFTDFYSGRGAIFQAGTLYLDARSCDLCVRVGDAGKHAALAGLARAYLVYMDCTRAGMQKMTIAAAVTAGDSDNLMIGRNGIFYDRAGLDWDATITKIVENPISIGQAFWSPYKKFVRMIEEQVAKRAAASDQKTHAKLSTAAEQVATADQQKGAAPAAVEKKRIDVGTVAALGVALGSIGTFLAMMFTRFIELGWWIPLGLAGIMLAISGPSMLIAWLKLRQRNLGPILDANGWAINGRIKINVPFGGSLSKRARIPPGAQHQLTDPFAEDHSKRDATIAIIVLAAFGLIAWRMGWFAGW